MSIELIKNYQRELAQIKDLGASNEMALKRPFANLLYAFCQKKNLTLVEEISMKSELGNTIRPDGTIKGINRLDWGYWESKDEADDIEEEVKKKFTKGYPNDNIIFEDTQTAILYQSGQRVAMANMQGDGKDLDALLTAFINFERPEYRAFREAIEAFKNDVPDIIKVLRALMEKEAKGNPKFVKVRDKFLKIAQDSINPDITKNDIREMIVQHILTEDIFNTIFDEADFHHSNNIAFELEQVIKTFFNKTVKKNFFNKIRNYYLVIQAVASKIKDNKEKQTFLKVIYEDFYKAYNPKGADKLGIVYTPNEIVRFMIESTDHLLYEHFGKELLSKNVEILDPATGTGTFITDLIDYFPSSKKSQIEYKYANEIHANEVSILPYYIANLNIEFAYQQKMGEYKEFENLVFVDTLDNMGFGYKGKQGGIFTSISAENLERIKKQNKKKISVIIGNPPYNANQQNENDNNKNREYPAIDKRIKESFVKESTAQKTKVYDMYARFYRWAMDRIDKNGIIAFITNRSFIDSRTFDGFRKIVGREFQEIHIIDLKGDIRKATDEQGGNVFNIMTGVAIAFFIKDVKQKQSKIFYHNIGDFLSGEEKLERLRNQKFEDLEFELVKPDKKHNWINLTDNDFEDLIPICDKDVKAGKSEKAIFKLFANSIKTNRDEWVYDFDRKTLENKVKFFIEKYNKQVDSNKYDNNELDYSIKWSSTLKEYLYKKNKIKFGKNKLKKSLWRPFIVNYYYAEKILNDRLTQNHYDIFGDDLIKKNLVINTSGGSAMKPFQTYATEHISDYEFIEKNQCLPLYRYTSEGKRIDNITQWAVNLFQRHYKNKKIQRLDIFHYVYAVLHNPKYREKYEQNLKRDFPRIPLYKDFWFWAEKGKELMGLHLNYESIKPFELKTFELSKNLKALNKPRLKADKEKGIIYLDEITRLEGIPKIAWEYKLGNRSALEWVLDQYKEKKPRDKTIAEKFNNYRFADYKEEVIELLQKVCVVSVKTMEIIEEMVDRG